MHRVRGADSQLNKPKKLKAPGFYHLIRQASPATFPVKGKDSTLSKSPYFYTLASIVILTILSILILNLRLSLTNATGSEGSTDTGIATLSRVDITQAGTGQSVTIDGTTLDEEGENNEVDNAKRRTILNNNVVRYQADLQVSTPGSLTLSITLPANNAIDEATIGSAQGCIAGSKLEAVTVDGKKSYTNNKATCVMNTTSIGQVSWGITAYLWGGNNTKIQPTISLSGQEQSQKPDPITVVGKGNYGISFTKNADQGFSSGYNRTIYPQIGLYVKGTENGKDSALLGVAPLDEGSLSITFNTSELPADYRIGTITNGINYQNMSMGTSVPVAKKSDDGSSAKISWSYATTATRRCIRRSTATYVNDPCFYAGFYTTFELPVSSLSSGSSQYAMRIQSVNATVGGQPIKISPDKDSYTWTIKNRNFGNPYIAGQSNSANVAWSNIWNDSQPVYAGESVPLATWIQLNTVPSSVDNISNNLNFCTTWNPSQTAMNQPAEKATWISTILSSYSVQYGIIGTDMSILPSSSQQYCGKYGDTNIENQRMFFNTLEEANTYAKQHNLKVNAMRLWSEKTRANIRDGYQLFFDLVPLSDSDSGKVRLNASATTNEWNKRESGSNSDSPSIRTYNLVPGFLSHTITAVPSSNAPNTTDHVTITPKTYNRDTNVKITTTLPKGLTYQSGSFRVGDHQLSQGLDYDIAKQSNGTTVITFNMDQIASIPGLEDIVGEPAIMPGEPGNDTDLPIAKDNNGNGIVRDVIEFDVLVDSNVPTPSTLTITSQVSGTGTNYAASTFRAASTSVTISQARVFGYNLTSSASSLNVNEDLTYTYSNYNLTQDGVDNLESIAVLPYNDDSRGTTGLIEDGGSAYQVASLSVSGGDGAGATVDSSTMPDLYYTTSDVVRQLEKSDPLALAGKSTNTANNSLAATINWVKCALDSTGKCTNLPTSDTITAIRWMRADFASDTSYYVNLTLSDINAEAGATIVNDLTYIGADTIASSVHQVPTTTNYVGETLELRLDKDTLTAAIDPAGEATATNRLTILANTRRGYQLTMSIDGSVDNPNRQTTGLVGQANHGAIPAVDTKPTVGTPGWAVSVNGANSWHKPPLATEPPLVLGTSSQGGMDSTTVDVNYAFATSSSTVADTYTNRVVYTLTAGL